jgi:hypothetical protein
MNDLAAIRARHDDIPQDPLPLDIPDSGVRTQGEQGRDQQKSVGQAACPWHTDRGDDQTTGLIRASAGLVFREHTKRIGKNTVRCPGSGRAPNESKETP